LNCPDQHVESLVVHSPHPAWRVPSQQTQYCLWNPLGQVKLAFSPE
jgi:hypothetical protein